MRIAIIGFGLIGSSIARAVLQRKPAAIIQAIDADPQVLSRAQSLALCHSMSQSINDLRADTDIAVLAAPVGAIINMLPDVFKAAGPKTVITDAGSVKSAIVERALEAAPEFNRFVPAHPMAGSHLTGPDHGRSDLFKGRRVFLTPYAATNAEAAKIAQDMFEMLGAVVTQVDPDEHDRIMAYVSHLPHFLAFAYMRAGFDFRENQGLDYEAFCAGGFRDFTRIAQSDSEMWVDIFRYNKDKILSCLEDVSGFISDLTRETQNMDFDKMSDFIQTARQERESIKGLE